MPKSRDDFDSLYVLIEQWRDGFNDRLKTCSKNCRVTVDRCLILDKKVRLLNEVGKLREDVKRAMMKQTRLCILTKNCQPLCWKGYKEKIIEMITLRTQLAREYKTFYDDLIKTDVTAKDRIDILCQVKKALQIHKCLPVSKLIFLLDEEMWLLFEEVQPKNLKYLRQRIESN